MKLTKKDEALLAKVHPELAKVVRRCASNGGTPFTIVQGVRSLAEQKKHVASGASKTMNSRHLASNDGLARAVDLAPIDAKGNVSWAWEKPGPVNDYFELAKDMQIAAGQEKVILEWGGVWDRKMHAMGGDMKAEVAAYRARRKAAGLKAFLDGPHFQLPRSTYP